MEYRFCTYFVIVLIMFLQLSKADLPTGCDDASVSCPANSACDTNNCVCNNDHKLDSAKTGCEPKDVDEFPCTADGGECESIDNAVCDTDAKKCQCSPNFVMNVAACESNNAASTELKSMPLVLSAFAAIWMMIR